LSFDDLNNVHQVLNWVTYGFKWLENDVFIFMSDSTDLSPFYSPLEPQGTRLTVYRVNINGTGLEEVSTLRPYMSLLETVSGFGVNRIIDTDPPAAAVPLPAGR
jgi:hypothetical protein